MLVNIRNIPKGSQRETFVTFFITIGVFRTASCVSSIGSKVFSLLSEALNSAHLEHLEWFPSRATLPRCCRQQAEIYTYTRQARKFVWESTWNERGIGVQRNLPWPRSKHLQLQSEPTFCWEFWVFRHYLRPSNRNWLNERKRRKSSKQTGISCCWSWPFLVMIAANVVVSTMSCTPPKI